MNSVKLILKKHLSNQHYFVRKLLAVSVGEKILPSPNEVLLPKVERANTIKNTKHISKNKFCKLFPTQLTYTVLL